MPFAETCPSSSKKKEEDQRVLGEACRRRKKTDEISDELAVELGYEETEVGAQEEEARVGSDEPHFITRRARDNDAPDGRELPEKLLVDADALRRRIRRRCDRLSGSPSCGNGGSGGSGAPKQRSMRGKGGGFRRPDGDFRDPSAVRDEQLSRSARQGVVQVALGEFDLRRREQLLVPFVGGFLRGRDDLASQVDEGEQSRCDGGCSAAAFDVGPQRAALRQL